VNAIRIAASAFIVVLITLTAMGWVWTGTHQPPAQAMAARAVLALAALAGVIGLIALWRRPSDRNAT
jgi:membrane protein YdbS with pleckstrin-like domain